MGFHRGPNIVTDSLLWALDADSIRSYPGTGTTWSDITITGDDFTASGDPTWTTEDGFELDGNDYFSSSLVSNDETDITVEAWFKFHTSGTDYGSIISRWQASGGDFNEFVLASNNGSTGPGYPKFFIDNTINVEYVATGTTLMTTGVWYHQVGTFDGTTVRVYINGVEQDNTAFSGTANTYRTQKVGIGAFGSTLGGGGTLYASQLTVRVARMYNKALTAAEVLQNFEETRLRFGI